MRRWWDTPEHEWTWWTHVRYLASLAYEAVRDALTQYDPKRRY